MWLSLRWLNGRRVGLNCISSFKGVVTSVWMSQCLKRMLTRDVLAASNRFRIWFPHQLPLDFEILTLHGDRWARLIWIKACSLVLWKVIRRSLCNVGCYPSHFMHDKSNLVAVWGEEINSRRRELTTVYSIMRDSSQESVKLPLWWGEWYRILCQPASEALDFNLKCCQRSNTLTVSNTLPDHNGVDEAIDFKRQLFAY